MHEGSDASGNTFLSCLYMQIAHLLYIHPIELLVLPLVHETQNGII
jgi:hypothetical protein